MTDSEEERCYDIPALYKHVQKSSNNKYANSSISVARSRNNIHLNRYNNVAPYDDHRVVLKEYNENDYINASVARSSVDPENQVYILAQGPLNQTIFDFWRMAWEKNCNAIVMLNKLIEQSRTKCSRYWPEKLDETMTVKPSKTTDLFFTVTLKDEKCDIPVYVIRDLVLARYESDILVETRDVKHFHYIAWPDFGVPETPDEFATFFDLLQMHKCFSNPESPSIVHCSAGIGRTGTLILVDSLLKKLKPVNCKRLELHEIVDDAYKEIMFLRQYRMGLIQTADQFDFSIKAIQYLHNRHVEEAQNNPPSIAPKEMPELPMPIPVHLVPRPIPVATSAVRQDRPIAVTGNRSVVPSPAGERKTFWEAIRIPILVGSFVIGLGVYLHLRPSPVKLTISDEL